MWYVLVGYWGGFLLLFVVMKKYNFKFVYFVQLFGNVGNVRDVVMDSIERYGIGVIDFEMINDFYNDYYSYFVSIDVDGVKVDVQNAVEIIGFGYGGRVYLIGFYQKVFEEFIVRNFKQNNLICCMSYNLDFIFRFFRFYFYIKVWICMK